MLPDHGLVLSLSAPQGPEPLDLVLDLTRGLLIVVHDVPGARWDARVELEPVDQALWAQRVEQLHVEAGGGEGSIVLAWRGFGDAGTGRLRRLSTQAGAVGALAAEVFLLALSSALDHPAAAASLSRWNTALGVVATVAFLDGTPRGARLVGMVDRNGQLSLDALGAVLRQGEPLWVDLRGCSSLGAWDPSELMARHVVGWVGARGGVRDRLRDAGVPTEAFHDGLRSAREWLRGEPG